MNPRAFLHFKRDMAAEFAVALLLHSLILCGLWRHQIIPPQPEAMTVYVSSINPAAPVEVAGPTAREHAPASGRTPKTAAPAAPKPVPVRQESPKPAESVAPHYLANAAPANSPAQPVAPPTPAAKANAAPVQTGSLPVSRPTGVSPPGAAVPQPVPRKDELSVSCSDRTPPAYPRLSARLGEQGKTVLLVELDEFGRVAHVIVKTTSGFPRLDEAAVTAVKSWRCSPAKLNGVAVRSVASQPFTFVLKGR